MRPGAEGLAVGMQGVGSRTVLFSFFKFYIMRLLYYFYK